jgi:mRNA interferase RelE/StbE
MTNAISDLAINPRPSGSKKLIGTKLNLWRIRIGDYRVLYIIDEGIKIVDIQKVGHGKDVYE